MLSFLLLERNVYYVATNTPKHQFKHLSRSHRATLNYFLYIRTTFYQKPLNRSKTLFKPYLNFQCLIQCTIPVYLLVFRIKLFCVVVIILLVILSAIRRQA